MAVAAYFPVPVIVTVCLLPFALSVIVSVPVCFIGAPGVNVTEIVQKEPAARVAGIMGQSLVSLNTPGSEIISINAGSPGCFFLPLGLDTLTGFGLLGVPSVVLGNLSALGVILSVTGTGVGVEVAVNVAVGVTVAVVVGVPAVAVGVGVVVALGVAVGVAEVPVVVAVVVGVGVAVLDPVGVAVAVAEAVAVAVRVVVAVALAVALPVIVVVAVAVCVAVAVGVGV